MSEPFYQQFNSDQQEKNRYRQYNRIYVHAAFPLTCIKFKNMGLKIFRVVWFLSVLALLATLLYGYAGWGEELIIQDDATQEVVIGREALFYTLVAAFGMVNLLVYVIGKLAPKELAFRAWFHGLVITINIFSIIAMNLIGVYNSTEHFDFSRIGIIIYGSIALVLAWAIAWPFYLLYQKYFVKQVV